MKLFDMFKKKNEVIKGNDNMEHIWKLTDTNDFVVAMTEHLDMWVLFLYAVRGIHIQNCEIEGHLNENAQYSLLGASLHQWNVCGVFHLASRIKDEALGGVFGLEHKRTVIKRFDCHCTRLCKHFNRIRIRAVIISHVDGASPYDNGKSKNDRCSY